MHHGLGLFLGRLGHGAGLIARLAGDLPGRL